MFVWPDEGPGFRPAQQRWGALFPFPGSGALNRMVVHPSIVDFAERALGSTDIRLYQAQASAKYAGITNYEQPMHIDRNHSWLPAGSEAPWWNLEGFLYLTDVTEDDNPTASRLGARHQPRGQSVRSRHAQHGPRRLRRRAARPGDPRFVPRLPVRLLPPRVLPSDPAPGPASSPPSPSSRPASTGSDTTPSRTVRSAWSGRSSSRARRRASWSSSAGPRRGTRSGPSGCSTRPSSATPRSTWARGERHWTVSGPPRQIRPLVEPDAVRSGGPGRRCARPWC